MVINKKGFVMKHKKHKHFVCYDPSDKVIWGIGENRTEAKAEGVDHAKHFDSTINTEVFLTIPCSPETYAYIAENGWTEKEGNDWYIVNGVLELKVAKIEAMREKALLTAESGCENVTKDVFRLLPITEKLDIIFEKLDIIFDLLMMKKGI